MKTTENTGNFADRLSDLISKAAQNGITLRDIERATGVKKESISKYQNNKAEPGLNSIVALAKYFNVSADYLLGLSDAATTDTTVQEICKKTELSEDLITFLMSKDESLLSYASKYGYIYCYPSQTSLFLNQIFKNFDFQKVCSSLDSIAEIIKEENTPERIKAACMDQFVLAEETEEGRVLLTRKNSIDFTISQIEKHITKAIRDITGYSEYEDNYLKELHR